MMLAACDEHLSQSPEEVEKYPRMHLLHRYPSYPKAHWEVREPPGHALSRRHRLKVPLEVS